MKNITMTTTDLLAIDRTRLANERTFLAYFRTFIVFLSSGFAILKMDALSEIPEVGYFLVILSPVLLAIGLIRFLYVKKHIKKFYKE
jgi:putative membrane protein